MLSARRFVTLPIKRLYSSSSNVIEHLENRTLIQVCGPDVSQYLQGLITNDIEHLNTPNKSMYTMFLNTKGRTMYDAIIYRNNEPSSFLIECDKEISNKLQKLLKLYRVKRKIDIIGKEEELKIYALFNPNHPDNEFTKLKSHNNYEIYRDPRISQLGCRIITQTNVDIKKELGDIVKFETNSSKTYRWLRYSFGVGEGINDLPPGDCFPLECNCDYLHGVSFHKGCYIGQELTARVHHTGVVRKRLMPLYFSKIPSKLPEESIIHEKVNLGKFRGIENDVGLALIRFDKAAKFKQIQIGDGIATTSKPFWWPNEAPKEQINKSQ